MLIWSGYGNLLDHRATKVIPCNAAGAMGKGLAKQARDRWPELYEAYKATFAPGMSPLSMEERAHVVLPVTTQDGNRFLLLCSKYHWRHPASLALVEDNLTTLAANWQRWQLTEVALPLLGCGLGELDREEVKALTLRILGTGSRLPIRLYLGLAFTHEA